MLILGKLSRSKSITGYSFLSKKLTVSSEETTSFLLRNYMELMFEL